MVKIDLCGAWQGACQARNLKFPATVPGCAHTDLAAAGELPTALYWRDNAEQAQWIEQEDFVYTKTFTVNTLQPGAVLVFECLDTYAEVYLNGQCVGKAENMFIPHRFAVDGVLTAGENELTLYFHSPIARTKGCRERSHAFTGERLYTRRMQCTYGWDWTMRFVTCGISKPCYLVFENQPAVESVSVYTVQLDRFGAELCCDLFFKNRKGGFHYTVEIVDPKGQVIYQNSRYCDEAWQQETVCLEHPQLWQPNGMGAQPLYTLAVTVGAERFIQTFGVRTVRLLQLPDTPDSAAYNLCRTLQETKSGREYDNNKVFSSFTVLINGQRVFCKGADWAPCEPLVSEMKNEKITRILELSAAAGLNMLRVWGGGWFESAHFYNECDRLGIMVTQDFLMACGHYPEDEPWFLNALQQEAEYAACYLRNHPCLIWWTGDNENAVRGNDQMSAYPGRTAAFKAIAPVLKKLDPTRRFLPSSPYGGDRYASKTAGTTHNTQFLNTLFELIEQDDLTEYKELYKEFIARFIAEEPAMGAVSTPSLLRMMEEADVYERDEMWYYHTQSNPGLQRHLLDFMICFAEKVLGPFENGADRCFKLQYLHYEWMRVSFEQARRNLWFCSGILYWMLADCWPAAVGWSLIDYYGLPKAAYYCFKRCAKSLTASIDRVAEKLEVTLTNDSPHALQTEMTLTLLNYRTGHRLFTETQPVNVAAQSTVKVPTTVVLDREQILICDLNGTITDRAFYKKGKLPLTAVNTVRVLSQQENRVTVTADSYVHAVRLEGGFVFEENYFSLLPGEQKTVCFSKAAGFENVPLTVTGYTLK